jgi:hypothetical protein
MKKAACKFALAVLVYAAFSVYLYQPYFKRFDLEQVCAILNLPLAGAGCYLLSRRWVGDFTESFFAGLMYGFGPFFLGLGGYHPAAGFLCAVVPWLFLPGGALTKHKGRWLGPVLSLIPVLAIILFFRLTAFWHFFAIPMDAKLHPADLKGLIGPLVTAGAQGNLIGFYHVPMGAVLMGISMLVAARRFGIMLLIASGTILAFCDSFFGISPVVWLSLPMVCCSVLTGVGMGGLIRAGFADRNWLLAIAGIMTVLAITAMAGGLGYVRWFGSETGLLLESARMYLLGAITVAILFFIARAGLHNRIAAWLVLSAAMALDVFLGAREIVDAIF